MRRLPTRVVGWLVDAAMVGALAVTGVLTTESTARASVDAGVPDARAIDGDPVALYGVRDTGCSAADGALAPGASILGVALLRRRRER